jgi:hypothetical protein
MKNIGVASTQGPHPHMDRIVGATKRFVVAGGGKAVELASLPLPSSVGGLKRKNKLNNTRVTYYNF